MHCMNRAQLRRQIVLSFPQIRQNLNDFVTFVNKHVNARETQIYTVYRTFENLKTQETFQKNQHLKGMKNAEI